MGQIRALRARPGDRHDLVQQGMCAFLVPPDQAVGEPRLHPDRDEPLLRAVVQIPFEFAPLGILRRARRCREARSSSTSGRRQYQTRLRGDVRDQPVLLRSERLRRRHPKEIAPAARRRAGPAPPPPRRSSTEVPSGRAARVRPVLTDPASAAARSHTHHTVVRSAPVPAAMTSRHPRKHILARVGRRRSVGELREHLVRGRPPPVHNAVGEPARPTADRLEREGDDPAASAASTGCGPPPRAPPRRPRPPRTRPR